VKRIMRWEAPPPGAQRLSVLVPVDELREAFRLASGEPSYEAQCTVALLLESWLKRPRRLPGLGEDGG
jgi:hypothetical protein